MIDKNTLIDKNSHEFNNKINLIFDHNGLIPAIAQDVDSKKILMMAWMNQESFDRSVHEGIMYYYSRSKQKLWLKGETSGQIQTIKSLYVDCDQDCLLAHVSVGGDGGACHVGYQSCFYRQINFKDLSLVINE